MRRNSLGLLDNLPNNLLSNLLNGEDGGSERMMEVTENREEQIEKTLLSAGIGQKIRRLRLKRSMGLVEMGAKTGLSASYLSQLETGRVIPTLRNLTRIALVFKTDLSYFFESKTKDLVDSSAKCNVVDFI